MSPIHLEHPVAANYSTVHYHFTKYVIRLKPSDWANYVIIDFLDVHVAQWSIFFEKYDKNLKLQKICYFVVFFSRVKRVKKPQFNFSSQNLIEK